MRKKIWFVLVVAAIVVIGISFFAYRQKKSLEITYREVRVARGNLQVTVLATGTVQPENRLEIKPPVAGRVEKILVKEGQLVKKGQILAWMSSTERAAMLDAARAQGPEEIQKWEENYKPTPIFAPINGTIILRNVEAGQTFTNADSVFVMSDRLTVKAQVDETDIAQIKLKQSARIVLDAYPKETIPAQVDQIAFDAKTVNNVTTYVVDVLPETTPAFMRSGMTANVTFLIESKNDVLTVPNEVLKAQESSYSVLVKGGGEKGFAERPVEIGISDGKKTEIVKGLSDGEILLLAEIKAPQGKSEGKNPFGPPGMRRGGR
jgi:macrolide-specific efflux system membrane fusion protein